MGLFSTIMSKIFGHAEAATPSTTAAPAEAAAAPAAAAPAAAPVDVDAVLSGLAANAGQPLNYKTSIVDLLKLLGLDSSLQSRKELAGELHYSGSTDDTATMNVWLIKQVYAELAKNGGKVPADWTH
ncbi:MULTISPECIES: DUF3597 domain-containing protein [Gluconobacter]|uniref:DUF3597 domain-containing protein n=2 Tax=Gluconobacter TaxID=441 RepID=A0AA37WAZ8_9PROT|nr:MULTISPECIES: DUF3597 domain-containing protein [Gluconobacter]MBF0861967.1 DUF3597 domain-containing protein [Gluconobacter kanchanaburiensis]MBF0886121.1 DUF3597 domain-containing protein [Gluconobacter sphaericus]GBR55727.1 hypothetical protein AA12467_2269 [Gluconobacter sphaericus NBRC 12467]GBR67705.1 hypothetical protein AA103587_0424 [Gluconobacter kanchanaburiensis NBRC 103587]GEB43404.1 hypothetical protein GSP01_21860 [Gluconobacter sphaericus NBRC 12467]